MEIITTPDCEQIRKMSHALGIPNAKIYHRHGKKYIKTYRNYYYADFYDLKWRELCENGYATRQTANEKYICYLVSDKGVEYINKHLRAIIKERD